MIHGLKSKGFKLTLRHVSGARNTARGALWRGEENPESRSRRVMPITRGLPPLSAKGVHALQFCLSKGGNAQERQAESEANPCLWMYYTAVTNGYVAPRGPSGFREDGFYFEVFPPIVH